MDNKLRHQIYLDIFQPSAQRIGMSLFCVTDGLASRFEKWCYRLDKEILLENQISPPAHMLVPILEGMVYHEDNTPIQEMFYNLLVNSMDKTKQDFCHPAFPKILSQLSIDEIIVLYQYNKNNIKEKMDSPTTLSFAVDTKSTIKSYLVQLGLLALFDLSQVANGAYGYTLQCSSYGERFIKACINEKAEELIREIIKNNPK